MKYNHYIGHTAGGLAINIAASHGFKWGVGSGVFFSGAYILEYFRGRDDFLNYAVSGALSYGLYRSVKFGPKGAIPGALMGLTVGVLYNFGTEYTYSFCRLSWIKHRRYLMTENRPILISNKRVSPFPPTHRPAKPMPTDDRNDKGI